VTLTLRQLFGVLCLTGLSAFATSCATSQSRFVHLEGEYPSRPAECEVEIFREGVPGKEFVRISRLDVHLEKTHFIRSRFEDALPELKKQACLSGADAVIEIRDRSTAFAETEVYHITATGIRYK
jgi:hypothetical protein